MLIGIIKDTLKTAKRVNVQIEHIDKLKILKLKIPYLEAVTMQYGVVEHYTDIPLNKQKIKLYYNEHVNYISKFYSLTPKIQFFILVMASCNRGSNSGSSMLATHCLLHLIYIKEKRVDLNES